MLHFLIRAVILAHGPCCESYVWCFSLLLGSLSYCCSLIHFETCMAKKNEIPNLCMLGHGSANCRFSTLAIWTLRFAASSSSPTNCALSSLSFNSLKCFSMRSTSSCKLSATASEGCGSLPCGSSSWLREPVARGLGRGARFGLPVGHIQLVGQTQEFPPLLTRDFPFSVVCHGGSLTPRSPASPSRIRASSSAFSMFWKVKDRSFCSSRGFPATIIWFPSYVAHTYLSIHVTPHLSLSIP